MFTSLVHGVSGKLITPQIPGSKLLVVFLQIPGCLFTFCFANEEWIKLPAEPPEIKLSHVEGGNDASGTTTKERMNEHINHHK